MPLDPGARAALVREVEGPILDVPETIERFSRDASPFSQAPDAVVAPRDRDAVVRLVLWARRFRVPLVARGGGSSLEGESVPTSGSVVVDLSGWNKILERAPADRLVRVGPGIVNRELHRALQPDRLFFPPNPGSWTSSTIGGNVATNASGPRSFRYGPTRAWVRGLEVVLGTGEVLRLGHRARKSSTGPDLLGFMVGSEGTLGLFTEVTLGLAPVPERRIGLVVPLPPEVVLQNLLHRLVAPPTVPLSAVEYLDQATAHLLAREEGTRLPEGSALLLLELETDAVGEEATLRELEERLRSVGLGTDARVYPEADQLWTVRGQSSVALDRELGRRVREDVAVPWSRLGELTTGLKALEERYAARLYVYGHLGDGSLHPNFLIEPLSPEGLRLRRDVLLLAKRLGGTISAEHGIGLLKAPYLALEHGEVAVGLLRSVKQWVDPDGVLNPGKLYPPAPSGGRAP